MLRTIGPEHGNLFLLVACVDAVLRDALEEHLERETPLESRQ